MAIEVIGQGRSSNVAALFLKDWELGRVALSCHMTVDLFWSRWAPLVHCVRSDRKEGGGVLMPGFLLSMWGLACRLCTVLNILCLLRNEGLLSFRCVAFVLCTVQKVG